MKQEKFDTGIQTKFMDYIDVPASSKKDFKLAFYAYKESFTSIKVCHVGEYRALSDLTCYRKATYYKLAKANSII